MTTMTATRGKQHRLGMHQGRVLVDQLADRYHTLLLTMVEMAQNAIDANATSIFVGINQKTGSVVVLDDGDGIDEQKFGEALMSVGQSVKAKGSLGRFGLGMISPLNKCKWFRIVSQPRGSRQTREWKFVGADIRKQSDAPEIPSRLLPKMPAIPMPFGELVKHIGATWRTFIQLTEVTKDRTISVVDIEELAQQIQVKLGRGMRKHDAKVYLAIVDGEGTLTTKEVDPLEYRGQPFKVVPYDLAPCGHIEFRLFRAPKSDKGQGAGVQVLRLNDNRAISWSEFQFQAFGSGWGREESVKAAFKALGSGYFNGSIQGEHLELDSEGSKFVMNDAVRALYIAIDQWYIEHGKALYEEATEERREERYRQLGERSLAHLYQLLEDNAAFATITPELSATSASAPFESEETEEDEGGKTKTADAEAKPRRKRVVAKHPGNSSGGSGSNRPPAREPQASASTQKGRAKLNFAYDMLPGEPELWTFDPTTATLVFNIRHPVWEQCDETGGKRSAKHDRQIMHLQEWVAIEVLSLLARHPEPDDFHAERWRMDEAAPRYAVAFILR
jgi:hypothetical protein